MKRFVFAAAVLMLFACSKEDQAPELVLQPAEGGTSIFYAETEGAPGTGTKVYADDQLRLLWNANDSITIFNKSTQNKLYCFTGDDGDSGGSFDFVSGSSSTSPTSLADNYALYPYFGSASINSAGTQITTVLPYEQIYKENSFGDGANTMVAVCDGDENHLSFKNVCGFIKFRFYGHNIKIKKVTLEGNGREQIAGRALITPSMDDDPTVVFDGSAAIAFRYINLICPQPVPIGLTGSEATDFILVVPPVTFANGFKVRVTDILGGVSEVATTNSLTIERNRMETMEAVAIVPDYSNAYVDFDDDAFKAYCVENFDSDDDGDISIAEAEVPTSMDVSNLGIRSMKGLECFVNLTSLDCNVNQITELDVSNLVHLETLFCNGNQLTSLDLSSNTALEQVYCTGNQLYSLDLGSNSSLINLNVTSNQLSSLDLSGTPNLNTVIFSNNHIRNIDLTACPDLTLLRCDDNLLSSIDLSNNTALAELDVSDNRLTSLDLAANTALVTVNCVSNRIEVLSIRNHSSLEELRCGSNTRMTSLVCRDNRNLTVLNVRGNRSLQTMDVSGNKLQIIGELKTCTSLETLLCGSNRLTDFDVSDMTSLKVLHAAWNSMTSINVSGCTALEDLDCRRNSLTTLDISTNTALSVLSCEYNSLTSLDVSHNLKLVELRAQNNQLASISFTTLLGAKVNLKTLWVQNNQLTSMDLSKLLKLETLYCHDNSLFALSVVNNTNLTKLAAWSTGATGSIARLSKASGQNITYLASDHSTVIDPTGEPWNTLIANL